MTHSFCFLSAVNIFIFPFYLKDSFLMYRIHGDNSFLSAQFSYYFLLPSMISEEKCAGGLRPRWERPLPWPLVTGPSHRCPLPFPPGLPGAAGWTLIWPKGGMSLPGLPSIAKVRKNQAQFTFFCWVRVIRRSALGYSSNPGVPNQWNFLFCLSEFPFGCLLSHCQVGWLYFVRRNGERQACAILIEPEIDNRFWSEIICHYDSITLCFMTGRALFCSLVCSCFLDWYQARGSIS